MIDIIWLQVLVSIDIVLSIAFKYLESNNRKTPLSSIEFHFFMQDLQERLNNIIDEDSKERRKELMESELRTYDRIRRIKDGNTPTEKKERDR